MKVKVKLLSRVQLCDPWTVAYQAPPSMGFSRQEYWSGLPLPSPSSLLDILNFPHHTNMFSAHKYVLVMTVTFFFLTQLLSLSLLKVHSWYFQILTSLHSFFFFFFLHSLKDSLVAQMVKRLHAMRETWVPSLV